MARAPARERPIAPDIDYTENAARKRAAQCRFDRDAFHLPTTSDAPIVTVTIPQQGWQGWLWPMLAVYADGEVLANRRHCGARRCTDSLERYQVTPAAAQQLRAALHSRLRGSQHALSPGYYASEGQATQIFFREGATWRVYAAYGWFCGEFLDTVAAYALSPRAHAATLAHPAAPSLHTYHLPEPEPPPLAFAQAFATADAFRESLANAGKSAIESVGGPHIGPIAEPHIAPAAFTLVLHPPGDSAALAAAPWPAWLVEPHLPAAFPACSPDIDDDADCELPLRPYARDDHNTQRMYAARLADENVDARDPVYRIGARNVMLTLVPHYRGQAWVRTAQICADQRGWLARY